MKKFSVRKVHNLSQISTTEITIAAIMTINNRNRMVKILIKNSNLTKIIISRISINILTIITTVANLQIIQIMKIFRKERSRALVSLTWQKMSPSNIVALWIVARKVLLLKTNNMWWITRRWILNYCNQKWIENTKYRLLSLLMGEVLLDLWVSNKKKTVLLMAQIRTGSKMKMPTKTKWLITKSK